MFGQLLDNLPDSLVKPLVDNKVIGVVAKGFSGSSSTHRSLNIPTSSQARFSSVSLGRTIAVITSPTGAVCCRDLMIGRYGYGI